MLSSRGEVGVILEACARAASGLRVGGWRGRCQMTPPRHAGQSQTPDEKTELFPLVFAPPRGGEWRRLRLGDEGAVANAQTTRPHDSSFIRPRRCDRGQGHARRSQGRRDCGEVEHGSCPTRGGRCIRHEVWAFVVLFVIVFRIHCEGGPLLACRPRELVPRPV